MLLILKILFQYFNLLRMRRLDHWSVIGFDPTSNPYALALQTLWVELRLFEKPLRLCPDGNREIGSPVCTEIHIGSLSHRCNGVDGSFHDLESGGIAGKLSSVAGVIKGMPPDTPAGGARFSFENEHFGNIRPIVSETVYPRHSPPQQFPLQPEAVGIMQVRQQAVVTVDASAAI